MNNNREILETINKIEMEFPVNDLVYKDIMVWPLIRSQIAMNHMSKNLGAESIKNFTLPKRRLRQNVKTFFFTFRRIVLKIKLSKILKEYAFKNKDYIYISREDEKKNIQNGKVNTLALAWEKTMSQCGDTGVFELDSPLAIEVSRLYSQYYFLNERAINVKMLLGFNHFLQKQFPEVIFNSTSLLNSIKDIFIKKELIKSLMLSSKCRYYFMSVYYTHFSFAISLAASELNLNSVEVQHGQTGENNPLNISFRLLPRLGYSLLPKTFWLWGETSAIRMKEFSKNEYHNITIAGHPSVNEFYLTEKHVNSSKSILVALQDLPVLIDEQLRVALIELSKSYTICFRLHPKMLHRIGEVKEFAKNLASYQIEESTFSELYQTMASSECVISHWSSVVYEALGVGVKALVVGDEAKIRFGDSIEKGEIKHACESLEIIKFVKERSASPKSMFIERNQQTILFNLKRSFSYE